jgi:hypothetical protein
MIKNNDDLPLQNVNLPIESTIPPTGKAFRVRSAQGALRLLGRILYNVKKREIDLAEARLLIYGCSVYVQAVRDAVFEERLEAIEKKLRKENNHE